LDLTTEPPSLEPANKDKHPSAAPRNLARGRNFQRLGYRRIVQMLVYLIIIPAVMLLSTGLLMMFLEQQFNLLFGILTLSFVGVLVTGVVLVWVFLRREANLSELQADFVSKVSHELRTPLTAIRLFAETMDRAQDNPETVAQCRKLLVEETERLSSLIERLLDWGRMESGRKLYELRDCNVADIVREAAKAFETLQYGEAVDFQTEVPDGLPQVRVDKAAVVDALVNLLSNAKKYGGSPPLIRLAAGVTPKGEVRITVQDNGAGIPHEEHPRIFQKFYRIDDRLSRTREGSGLGLAIVKHIAHAHEARVDLDSKPGKGSVFALVFPRVPTDPDAKVSPEGALRG